MWTKLKFLRDVNDRHAWVRGLYRIVQVTPTTYNAEFNSITLADAAGREALPSFKAAVALATQHFNSH